MTWGAEWSSLTAILFRLVIYWEIILKEKRGIKWLMSNDRNSRKTHYVPYSYVERSQSPQRSASRYASMWRSHKRKFQVCPINTPLKSFENIKSLIYTESFQRMAKFTWRDQTAHLSSFAITQYQTNLFEPQRLNDDEERALRIMTWIIFHNQWTLVVSNWEIPLFPTSTSRLQLAQRSS